MCGKKLTLKKFIKMFSIIVYIIIALFLIWICISWIDIIFNNLSAGSSERLLNWNLFKILL